MAQSITDVISETIVHRCWQEYQTTNRIPKVSQTLEKVLESQGLVFTSEVALTAIIYNTTQRFQNLLLQERAAHVEARSSKRA
jgi:hypothetical protein